MKQQTWFVTAALMIGLARPAFVFHEFNRHVQMSYQAAAHIFVGFMLAAWLCSGDRIAKRTVIGLSAVEVACALLTAAINLGWL